MKLEQLRVLDAIVTQGSFRKASEVLYKSQPALSQAIKSLEEETGLTLLSRESYRPVLTPAGKAYYRQARGVLDQVQALKELAGKLSASQEAEVRLSVSVTCPLGNLLSVIGELKEAYPATDIRLMSDAMGGSAERLMAGEVDFIIATMDGLSTEAVHASPYTAVNIIPVAHPGYGPASSRKRLSNAEMRPYVQVVVAGTGQGQYDQSRDVVPESLRWTVSDFAAKKEIVLARMGWGGLPEHLIARELEAGELVTLDLKGYPIRRSQLHLVRRREGALGVVAHELWERLSTN
ncbi:MULTISPECIES: LysR family transcriptional regulator [unclassified Marinobacter]|uniref:LysR family transcriptional regulator n=2 Tax=Marinobacter TaxID=2742 RepID=W5YTG2_9GAMM|nr:MULTISPECIES: LysR family transcriptional regulator [unclassified Marinobacter]AHI32396.1 LysR family transcriptional regulator [Marinobacter salarius]MAB51215.1 LysR family transcriptional regulator [Marinobacter sp.]